MDLYFLNKDKTAKFQSEGLKYDPKNRTYLQEFTSPQVKRQKPIEDQDSKKEWINTVTSDEFKREFFDHPARISVCSLKPKHKDEDYISSEYSVSSDGKKQTKYKAIVIVVLFISCLMVLAVSGAIVFIFRHSSQNNNNFSASSSNLEPTEGNSTYSNTFPSTTLNIIKSSTLTSKKKLGISSTTESLAPSRANTEAILTTASKEDSSIAKASSETTKSIKMTTLSPHTTFESIPTDISYSATGSSFGLQVTTTNQVELSSKLSTYFTSFQANKLATIDSTTSIGNTNTNTVSPIATEKSSLTETTTTTAKSNRITESNDTSSVAVYTDISTETISNSSKEISTSTETTSNVPIQRNFTSETRLPTTVTIQIPSPEKQEIPQLQKEINTGMTHPVTSTYLEPFTIEQADYHD